MVQKYWLAVAFTAGIVVGVIVDRPDPDSANGTVPRPALPEPVEPAGVEDFRVAARPAAPKAPVPEKPPTAPAGNLAVEAATPDTTAQTDTGAASYSGYSEPIDVGPVFSEQFAESQKHGVKGSLFELHQNLEREVRNDAWAYAAESEIQNSLVDDASTGNFTVDHLECRATSCEVRLSAQGKFHSEQLSRWQQDMRSRQWGNGLEPRASSMIGQDDRTDILVILVKPEKRAPEKLPKAS